MPATQLNATTYPFAALLTDEDRVGGADAGASALICISGLSVEARIARRAGFSTVVGAGDRQRTEALAAAATAGADCLVSFGISGALSPELRPGDLILSAEIVSAHGSWHGEPAWRRRLASLAGSIGAASG